MKIAILTQQLWNNYGGILQNYALQTVLKRMGHDPYTVRYYRKPLVPWITQWLKYIVKILINHPNKKYSPPKFYYYLYGHNKGNGEFCKKYIQRSRPMKGINLKFIPEYDAFIVGSDQVWRPRYNWGSMLDYMFLEFLKDNSSVKKIAYAASFGVDEWEYDEQQTEKYKELIKQFDAISVRESSGVELCTKYLHADAIQVLDPTLMLSAADYRSLIPEEENVSRGDVCTYILDMTAEKQALIESFCSKNGLTWYTVGTPSYNGDYPSIESWLAGFANAKYVITDSFHGSVFSIIFNKPFVAIGNDERGMSRFNSLLKMFELEDRLIKTTDKLEKISEPDWNKVSEKLKSWQDMSLTFLRNNLQ